MEVLRTRVFTNWLSSLKDLAGQFVIGRRITRMQSGNAGVVRNVGDGVMEMKIAFGPGYRVYYIQRGKLIIILLCGGDKGSQERDIKKAKELAKLPNLEDQWISE